MAKVRVHELAKDLGVTSKDLLAKLQDIGEFVRSASSTVEAPVVRKLMEKFPDMKPADDAPKPVKKVAAKKVAAKPAAPTAAEIQAALAQFAPGTIPASVMPTAPVAPVSTIPTLPAAPVALTPADPKAPLAPVSPAQSPTT